MQDNKLTDEEYIEYLDKILKENNIDILGLQEIVYKVKKKLSNNNLLYGSSRIPLFKHLKYNEYNCLSTNYNVLKVKTYHLPFFFSMIPRIAVEIIIEKDKKMFRVINTHLCLYKYHKVKIKQFNKILKIVKKKNLPTIIMGDFNLRENTDDLTYFTDELKKLDIVKVKNNTNTYQNNILDYIFVSKDFDVGKVKVVKNAISDHGMLVADVHFKN